jgi:hypothetical protein
MLRLIAAAAVTSSVLFASPAAADTSLFINEARAAGFTAPEDELLRNGYVVCASSAQDGVNDDLIGRGIRAAQRWLGQPNDPVRDQKFIDLAQKYLCPSESQ